MITSTNSTPNITVQNPAQVDCWDFIKQKSQVSQSAESQPSVNDFETGAEKRRRGSNMSNNSTNSAVSTASAATTTTSESPEKKARRCSVGSTSSCSSKRKTGALTPMVLEDEGEGQRLYKTELCRSWEERGYCRYGDKCQFAHGTDELRPLVRHTKYKSELCRYFHVEGTCMYGTRCCFIHSFKKTDVAKVLSQNIYCLQGSKKRLSAFETNTVEEQQQ